MRHTRLHPAHLLLAFALLALVLSGCGGSGVDEDDGTPRAAAQPTSSPAPTRTPVPTPTPSPTPSPTPFIAPTVAVEDDDSIEECLERNMTPELLVSLSMDDTELTEDILRTCLETTIPSEVMFLLGPVVEDASDCALATSKELSNIDLIILGGPDSTEKAEITERVIDDILGCLGDEYGLDWF